MMWSQRRSDNRNMGRWLMCSFGCLFVVGGCLVVYPVFAADDPDGLMRSLLLRVATVVVGGVWLVFGLVFFDAVVPGDNLKSLGQNPFALAAVYSCMVIGLALIFACS